MQRTVFIDGRFELRNSPDTIGIFDGENKKEDGAGELIPVVIINIIGPKTDKEAGLLALQELRDTQYITMSEYYRFLEIFLMAIRPDGSMRRNQPRD